MGVQSNVIAALVSVLLLAGGVAAAAGMGVLNHNGNGVAPASHGDHGEHGGHGGHDSGGHHGGSHGGNGAAPCPGGGCGNSTNGTAPGGGHHSGHHNETRGHHGGSHGGCQCNASLVWVNATVTSVNATTRTLVVSAGNNTSMTLKVKEEYVDNATGYLVYGPWILGELQPGDTVAVLVGNQTLSTGAGPLLGIALDGRTMVAPGPAMGHQHAGCGCEG